MESTKFFEMALGLSGSNVSPMDPMPLNTSLWLSHISHFRSEMWPKLSAEWLGTGIAIDYLASSLPNLDEASDDLGCGQLAFAAFVGISSAESRQYFPERKWTNRRDMENALADAGWQYEKHQGVWPKCGLCLVHWVGPWTQRNYAPAILQHTHWVAVIEDLVYDVNWGGWLPKDSWEEVVVETVLRRHAEASGWKPLSAYEIAA